MSQEAWYVELFKNYGKMYDSEIFVQGTQGEVDFIENEIGHDRTTRILDLGCGTGRHTIELARRGYDVTGIDLSRSMLDRAVTKADEAGVDVRFIEMDARELEFRNEFDLVIEICEGAFPLMETDRENFRILQGVARALKPGGRFILTTLNGLYPLYHNVKEFLQQNEVGTATNDLTFDLLTFREHSQVEFTGEDGVPRVLQCNERYYVPPEITWLLSSVGFTGVDIFGAELGKFSREHRLTPDHFEMLIVASGLGR